MPDKSMSDAVKKTTRNKKIYLYLNKIVAKINSVEFSIKVSFM